MGGWKSVSSIRSSYGRRCDFESLQNWLKIINRFFITFSSSNNEITITDGSKMDMSKFQSHSFDFSQSTANQKKHLVVPNGN